MRLILFLCLFIAVPGFSQSTIRWSSDSLSYRQDTCGRASWLDVTLVNTSLSIDTIRFSVTGSTAWDAAVDGTIRYNLSAIEHLVLVIQATDSIRLRLLLVGLPAQGPEFRTMLLATNVSGQQDTLALHGYVSYPETEAPSILDLGVVGTRSMTEREVIIRNRGIVPAVVHGATFNFEEWSLVEPMKPGTVLPVGDSIAVRIRLTTVGEGRYDATLIVRVGCENHSVRLRAEARDEASVEAGGASRLVVLDLVTRRLWVGNGHNADIVIYDVRGCPLKQCRTEIGTVDVGQLPPGHYFISVDGTILPFRIH